MSERTSVHSDLAPNTEASKKECALHFQWVKSITILQPISTNMTS